MHIQEIKLPAVFSELRDKFLYPSTELKEVARACFINRFGLKLSTFAWAGCLMSFLHEQEAVRVVDRGAVGVDRALAA